MRAFYFAAPHRRLRYGDNRPIVVGETHTVDCVPKPCERGLHASIRPLDALRYAPGSVLYLVDLSGTVVAGVDKHVATERTYLAEFDASELLVRFACDCALEVVEQIKPYAANYDQIVAFLREPTARAAVRAAAYDAAYAAAYTAARAAADAAYAADAAARAYAAYAAADAAARAADAGGSDPNERLLRMLRNATGWDI